MIKITLFKTDLEFAGLDKTKFKYGIPVMDLNGYPLPKSTIKKYVESFKIFQRVSRYEFDIPKDIEVYLKSG